MTPPARIVFCGLVLGAPLLDDLFQTSEESLRDRRRS